MQAISRRVKHVGHIANWWWAVMYGVWTLLCSFDVLVEHYGTDSFRVAYNNLWIAPKWGWKVWIIGLLAITVLAVLEGSYRHSSALRDKHGDELSKLEAARAEAEARIYDGRPLLVLHVAEIHGTRENPGIIYDKSPVPPAKNKKLPQFVIDIQNCRNRTARWITIADARSEQGNYRLAFARLSVLEGKDSSSLSFEVKKILGGEAGTLSDFLVDTANDIYVTGYDIEITFRDTDESMQSDVARLAYWPGECVFQSVEVPYTRKDFRQQQ